MLYLDLSGTNAQQAVEPEIVLFVRFYFVSYVLHNEVLAFGFGFFFFYASLILSLDLLKQFPQECYEITIPLS